MQYGRAARAGLRLGVFGRVRRGNALGYRPGPFGGAGAPVELPVGDLAADVEECLF